MSDFCLTMRVTHHENNTNTFVLFSPSEPEPSSLSPPLQQTPRQQPTHRFCAVIYGLNEEETKPFPYFPASSPKHFKRSPLPSNPPLLVPHNDDEIRNRGCAICRPVNVFYFRFLLSPDGCAATKYKEHSKQASFHVGNRR